MRSGSFSSNGRKYAVFEEIEDGDFDWAFHFADGIPDRYYYCFKDEGCHLIYHRFLPEDYEELL